MLNIVAESCPTKIFLANPEMDVGLYREAFHLNPTEIDLIAGLIPPGQMVICQPHGSKKVRLYVDSVTHWMAVNSADKNLLRRDFFNRFGIPAGLRELARQFPFHPGTPTGALTLISKGAAA